MSERRKESLRERCESSLEKFQADPIYRAGIQGPTKALRARAVAAAFREGFLAGVEAGADGVVAAADELIKKTRRA